MHTIRFLALIIFTCHLSAEQTLRLPNIFGDKMVLQQGKPVNIWGWAKAGAEVKAQFSGQNKSAKADDKGKWTLQLDKLSTSFKGRELVITSGTEKITLTDILVGEVWVCGGQSNMEWSLRASRDSDLEVASANSPHIRFIRLPHIARPTAQEDFQVTNETKGEGNWRQAIPEQVENCTAVGYYFAQRLSRRLNLPVGLIDVSWGGTMAQHWVLKDTLKSFPEMHSYIEQFDEAMKAWIDGGEKDGADKRYAADLKAWEKARAEAKAKGEREPRRPNQNNYTTPAHKRQPGGMMNGMILPISNMTIAGALFYQGENNSFGTSWKPFHRTFPAVITDWRRVFGDEDLPMGLVQIAG
ncbi:MAG: sialate O-acetylesterase, partial [Verrucomicrobiota bacterium]|nr:sialate O-acetylesterase [Verrucomicrobiota bacterium]